MTAASRRATRLALRAEPTARQGGQARHGPPGLAANGSFLGFVTRYSVAIPDGNPDDAQCVIEAAGQAGLDGRRTMLNAMIEESRRVAGSTPADATC